MQTDLAVLATPKTQEATFTITARDVGTDAVRPGNMAQLEEERRAPLLACKAVLGRMREGGSLSAVHEFMLECAVGACE